MVKTKTRLLIIILVLNLFTATGCNNGQNQLVLKEATGFALGGFIQYKLYGTPQDTEAAFQEISRLLNALEIEFSANDSESFLNSLSKEAVKTPVKISPTMYEILELSLLLHQQSEGKFSPAVGPLVKLWNIGFTDPQIPSAAALEQVLPLIDPSGILLTKSNDEYFIQLAQENMSLDLGSIVKGYGAKEALSICQKHNLRGALLSINGNLAVFGQREDGKSWQVGIIDPKRENNDILGSFAAFNTTISTSGDYERYFEQDGIRYHHILDAQTAFPTQTDLKAVTIISPQGELADGLSTVVFQLGLEKGLLLLEQQYPKVHYLLVAADNSLWADHGFKESFSLSNKNYYWGENGLK